MQSCAATHHSCIAAPVSGFTNERRVYGYSINFALGTPLLQGASNGDPEQKWMRLGGKR